MAQCLSLNNVSLSLSIVTHRLRHRIQKVLGLTTDRVAIKFI